MNINTESRGNGGCRHGQANQQKAQQVSELPVPENKEPSVRRWPHPVAVHPPTEPLTAELHYIGCALSQQTQLLSEIKALLEQRGEKTASP